MAAVAPKVSVFIPVYNRERYLCVAVNSILAQTFTDFELLLVDDGSIDGDEFEFVESILDGQTSDQVGHGTCLPRRHGGEAMDSPELG